MAKPPAGYPADPNLERTWFGALLHQPQSLSSVVNICGDPGLIYDDTYQELWRGALGLYSDGLALDPAALISYVTTKGYLSATDAKAAVMAILQRKGSAANIESWTKMLYELYRRRQLLAIGADLTTLAPDMTRKVEDIVTELLDRARMTSGLRSVFRSDEVAARLKDELTLRFTTGTIGGAGLALGIPEFDDTLEGILPDDFVGLCGRQGTGKTFLMLQIQRNLLVNYDEGVIPTVSMEMSVDRLCWRHAGSLSGVSPRKIRTGDVNRQEYELAMGAYDFIIDRWKKRLRVYEGGSFGGPVTAEAIESALLAEQAQGPVLAAMIDNFGLLHGKDREAKEAQSKGLKRTTGRIKVPIFCVFHLNREQAKGDRRPQMSDLRETGQIEQDLDRGLLIDRKDERSNHIKERWDELGIVEGLGWFHWSKNREAPPSSPIHLVFDPRTLEYHTPPEGLVASADERGQSSFTGAAPSSASVLESLIHGTMPS